MPSRSGGDDALRIAVGKILEIHIPQPGDIFPVLVCVIDLDDNVLWLRVFQHKGHLLLETDGILRQVELYSRPIDLEDALTVIPIVKCLDHLFEPGISRAQRLQRCIRGQGIVDIVRRARRGIDVEPVHVKRVNLIVKLDMLCRIVRLRALPSAVRAVVDAQLSVVEEVILQLFPAFPAENTLPDLRAGNIVKDLFTDPVGDIGISAVLGKRTGKDIIAVDDERGLRHARHSSHQLIIGNIHLAETVQLVPGNIRQQSAVRRQPGQHAHGRNLIHLDAGKIRVQPSLFVRRKDKRRDDPVQHIRPGPVDDDFFPFALQGPAQDRVCGRLPVRPHSHDDLFPDLSCHLV